MTRGDYCTWIDCGQALVKQILSLNQLESHSICAYYVFSAMDLRS
jgi:hypothetical protein